MTDLRVAVVGGGMGGLLAAIALEQAGVEDVVVLEAEDRPGGCARTVRSDGYALEPGAGSFPLPHADLGGLLELGGVCVEAARSHRRYLHDGDAMFEVTSPFQALSRLSVPTRLRIMTEPLRRPRPDLEDESLFSFLNRRLGSAAGTMASELMAAGVFAGDGRELSVRSAFPMLAQLESNYGSLGRGILARQRARPRDIPRPKPHIPCGGMDVMFDSLAGRLQGRFRPWFRVSSVRPRSGGWQVEGPDTLTARHLILAVPAPAAAGMIEGEVAALLGRASSAPAVVAAFSGDAGQSPLPEGFGALTVGRGPVLGLLFESSYAPERSPGGRSLVKVIAGGSRHPEVVEWSDSELARSLAEEVNRRLGWPGARLEILARRSIPQYTRGHSSWLASLDSMVGNSLHLAGWSYRGPGLAHLAADARRIAGRITA